MDWRPTSTEGAQIKQRRLECSILKKCRQKISKQVFETELASSEGRENIIINIDNPLKKLHHMTGNGRLGLD
jgi:hypothetical protein